MTSCGSDLLVKMSIDYADMWESDRRLIDKTKTDHPPSKFDILNHKKLRGNVTGFTICYFP